MIIRAYKPSDCAALAKLFYDTVHTVNAADYSKEQLSAWATGEVDLQQWNEDFLSCYTAVAEEDGTIIGFGSITGGGYLDMMFVHKDFQGRGIASSICDVIEKYPSVDKIYAHVSITARPFFESRGYRAVKENRVEKGGTYLINYLMEKEFLPGTGEKAPEEKIRELREEDMDRVMEIWLEANKQAHSFIPADYWEDNAVIVRKLLPKAEVYVYESGRGTSAARGNEARSFCLQGFIGLNGCHIEGIFVCGQDRSKGIGKALLDHAKKKKHRLTLNVYRKNFRAVKFYEREGFRVCDAGSDDATGEEDLSMVWRE